MKVKMGNIQVLKGEIFIDMIKILQEPISNHMVEICDCKYCKVWKELIRLGVIEE